jgi:hypothetical protein
MNWLTSLLTGLLAEPEGHPLHRFGLCLPGSALRQHTNQRSKTRLVQCAACTMKGAITFGVTTFAIWLVLYGYRVPATKLMLSSETLPGWRIAI